MFAALLLSCVRPAAPPRPPVGVEETARAATPADLAWIRPAGEGWVVSAAPHTAWQSGEARCTSTPGSEWMPLVCDRAPAEVAVPLGVRPPVDLVEGAGDPSSEVVATDSDAVAEAMSQAAAFDGDIVMEVAPIRRFSGSGTFDLVAIEITTAAGAWSCGSEDYFASVTAVVDVALGVLAAAQLAPSEPRYVRDLHDVERDGVPEIHYGSSDDARVGTWRSLSGDLLVGFEPEVLCGG